MSIYKFITISAILHILVIVIFSGSGDNVLSTEYQPLQVSINHPKDTWLDQLQQQDREMGIEKSRCDYLNY